MRHLAVLTDFLTDLARHIAGHCGNKIRTSVRLALDLGLYVLLTAECRSTYQFLVELSYDGLQASDIVDGTRMAIRTAGR